MRLVKARAAADPVAGVFVRTFLLGRAAQPQSPPLAVATLHELVAAAPGWAIGWYLLGRQLFNQDDFERAGPLFARSLALGLSDEPIESEARRVLAVSLYRTGRYAESRLHWSRLAGDPRRPQGARDEASSWVARCTWAAGPGRSLAAAER
jgi:cytochrome c-type biogenesis protein CcmH/NrfG